MKRIICILISLCLILSLCSCAKTKPLSARTEEYIVSALGFEQNGDKISLFVEAIVVGTEGSASTEAKIIKGEAKSLKEAFSEVNKRIAQPLLLAHCAVIVLGENLSAKRLGEVYDYCYNEEEITLSVFAVATKSAEALLKTKPVSSVAVGYDMAGLIELQAKRLEFQNRLYEIMAARKEGQEVKIPFFEVNKEVFYFGGFSYYEGDEKE